MLQPNLERSFNLIPKRYSILLYYKFVGGKLVVFILTIGTRIFSPIFICFIEQQLFKLSYINIIYFLQYVNQDWTAFLSWSTHNTITTKNNNYTTLVLRQNWIVLFLNEEASVRSFDLKVTTAKRGKRKLSWNGRLSSFSKKILKWRRCLERNVNKADRLLGMLSGASWQSGI